MSKQQQQQQQQKSQQAKPMNLSNVDLIEKSLSRTNFCGIDDERDCGGFAWIDNVPNTLQFAINM